jgi:hypothetical protein
MPEDSNPGYDRGSADNYHYFTLPMALNYQRNSYRLWESAKMTAMNKDTAFVFNPIEVNQADNKKAVKEALTRYKVALQPEKQTMIWMKLCNTICEVYNGDVRRLFKDNDCQLPAILHAVQVEHKQQFPYLSGQKICNYWLYVMGMYTDVVLCKREALSVAPDTHVLQASVRLGLVSMEASQGLDGRQIVSDAWRDVLHGSGILPIDIHTPLWLWSRGGFQKIR